jgi:putative thioredoxin
MPEREIKPGISLAGAIDLEGLKHQVKAEPGQAGGAPAAGGYVIDVTQNNFQAVAQASATYPIVIFMWVPTDNRLFDMARELGDAVNGMDGKLQLARIDVSRESLHRAGVRQMQGAPALFASDRRPPDADSAGPAVKTTNCTQITDAGRSRSSSQVAAAGRRDRHRAVHHAAERRFRRGQFRIRRQCAGTRRAAGASAEAYTVWHSRATTPVRCRRLRAGARTPSRTTIRAQARGRAKALLLARSANADVREAREPLPPHKPDDLDAQLAVADVDMIGGQIQDAFDRLLDYRGGGPSRPTVEPVRQRHARVLPRSPRPTDERLAARTSPPRHPHVLIGRIATAIRCPHYIRACWRKVRRTCKVVQAWAHSSVDRAFASGAKGRGFESH